MRVQTDGERCLSQMSDIEEPPKNDPTVAGEENLPSGSGRMRVFKTLNPSQYYHQLQVDDFLSAVIEGRRPLVADWMDGERWNSYGHLPQPPEKRPIRFPLRPRSMMRTLTAGSRQTVDQVSGAGPVCYAVYKRIFTRGFRQSSR